jgi:hypothetical protein
VVVEDVVEGVVENVEDVVVEGPLVVVEELVDVVVVVSE